MTSAEAVAVLRDELADPKYAGKTSREVQRMLVERPLIPNDETAPQIPQPFTLADIKGAIADFVALPVEAKAALQTIIVEQTHVDLGTWAGLWLGGAEADAVNALATRTCDDPTHPTMKPSLCRLEELGIAHIVWPDESETNCAFHGGFDLVAEARE